MNYLIDHPEIDLEYAELLKISKPWIKVVFHNRNAFSHNFAPFFGFESDGHVMFEHRESKKTELYCKKQFESVESYLTETTQKLRDFLTVYVIVQRNKILESEKTLLLRKAKQIPPST